MVESDGENMATMAKWGPKKWAVSSESVVAIEEIAFAYEQVADENTATEEKKTVNKRGIELFSLSFSTVFVEGLGVDVWDEIQSWKALVTKANYFYLNGKKIYEKLLQLRQVSVSEVKIDNNGRIRMAKLAFTFKEYDEDTTSVKVNTSALKVTASKSAKKAKKTTNTRLKKSDTSNIKVGSYIKLTGEKFSSGQAITEKMKQRSYKVKKISGDKILISLSDGTETWVGKDSITLTK